MKSDETLTEDAPASAGEKTQRVQKTGAPEIQNRANRTDIADKSDKSDRPDQPGRHGNSSTPERPEEPGIAEKTGKPDTPRALPAPEGPGGPALEEPREPHRRRRWPWVVGILVLALIAFLVTRNSQKKEKEAAATKKQQANRSVPVTAAAARSGDLGVYLSGLGTVTAINTVTVRSRVDGALIHVNFREGQLVHAGDLLAEIDPRPFQVQLMQADGQKAKDEAALTNARLDLKRYQVLAQQDSIPRQQLDTQGATVQQAEAAVKTDEGQVAAARLNVTYSRITAPITGSVGLRLVDVGNIVHASDANGIVVITQLAPINVIFTIPADQLPPVLSQMKAGRKLGVDAWDRELKNKLASGYLFAVDNQIDPTTGTVKIKAQFANDPASLYSNQFVNARLLVDTLHGVVIIPAAAIQRSPQSTYVWHIKPDSTVEMRPIEVQITEGEDVAIRKGLAPGDSVVIDGVDKLQPGMKVSTGGGNGAGTDGKGAAPGGKGAGRSGAAEGARPRKAAK